MNKVVLNPRIICLFIVCKKVWQNIVKVEIPIKRALVLAGGVREDLMGSKINILNKNRFDSAGL